MSELSTMAEAIACEEAALRSAMVVDVPTGLGQFRWGDVITFYGAPRWWQRLLRRPRRLHKFTVIGVTLSEMVEADGRPV